MGQSATKPEIVAECLAFLRRQKIHSNFAGYLCLKRTAARYQTTQGLHPDFKEFFDTFLRIPDASSKKPYVMPFIGSSPSEANKWFNKNVAGSYAQSSIRVQNPFSKVITISGTGQNTLYSLVDKHWEIAHSNLAYSRKIPIVPLAVFLYRDFALEIEQPTVRDWVDVFREEFGYATQSSSEAEIEFYYLFSDDSDSAPHLDWFQPVPQQ